MSIPNFQRFIDPLLRFLALHPNGVDKSEADEAVAAALGLTDVEKDTRLPSGKQPVYKNRSGWAHDRLKRAGLSTSPKIGVWKITKAGRDLIKKHPTALPESEITRIANTGKDAEGGRVELPSSSPVPIGLIAQSSTQGPDERIAVALAELRESVSRDLLERISQAPPSFFENLVLELLHAMGYGASREAVENVGGSGDGGIDGIISLDRLGLEKVYIQAKRWSSTVGRPEIQGFYGALAGRRATKGVFLTTSSFSKEAKEFAIQVEKIVLVDGAKLTDLMMDYGVGVTHKLIKQPKVDSDYFEDS